MKRIYLSLWYGFAMTTSYLLLLLLLYALSDHKIINPYRELLLMPLALPWKLYGYFFESGISGTAGGFGFATGLFAISFLSKVILYALLAYAVLWYRARPNRLP